MFRIIKFVKGILIVFPLSLIFYPFSRLFIFLYHFNAMILWIYKHRRGLILNDFFSIKRDYQKRYQLYEALVNHYGLDKKAVTYLEFGVAHGASFQWWQQKNVNPDSCFFGFDTFEGLPEKWGSFYAQGDMKADIPQSADSRGRFIKGLFQDTLNSFIQEKKDILSSGQTKIIHMDADLYSATLFSLSQLYPFIRKGDIILFDEFNVPLHEFKAFREFTTSFYIKLKPVAAVNNFYQTAFEVE